MSVYPSPVIAQTLAKRPSDMSAAVLETGTFLTDGVRLYCVHGTEDLAGNVVTVEAGLSGELMTCPTAVLTALGMQLLTPGRAA